MKKIKRNAIQCKLCQTVVESKNVHDYVTCRCGHVSVDGGLSYLKRSGYGNYIELSEYEEIDNNVYEKEV